MAQVGRGGAPAQDVDRPVPDSAGLTPLPAAGR